MLGNYCRVSRKTATSSKHGYIAQLTMVKVTNQFIPLKDGIRLSARIWLPEDVAGDNPVPAILEALPYRHRDMTVCRDEITYDHFAKHGYAGVRVDLRGCGDSTGQIQDEYVKQEQDDIIEVIDWIAKQSWCSGNVGMMGISWGGFNTLQVAYEKPKSLKAIIAICFTDDRYSDDLHYKGGAMLMDNLIWSASMMCSNLLPPDPTITKDNWKQLWLERIETAPPLTKIWLSHQTRDQYWKHASICEDYDRIKIPTFLIGGYIDAYTTTVVRTLNQLKGPKRALIGPWVHLYPHIAVPKPQWGFCTEAVKWWDEHLKGHAPSEDVPGLIAYVQDMQGSVKKEEVPGKWVTMPETQPQLWFLNNDGNLSNDERGDGFAEIASKETVGQAQGTFFPCSLESMANEMTIDDSESVCFQTSVSSEDGLIDYLGCPIVKVSVASNKPFANLFTRLCVVDSEGNSRQIAYTSTNLNHDSTNEEVIEMKDGEFKEFEFKLDYIGETIKQGSRLRLCFSTALFPMFVPNPEPTKLKINLSKCSLEMPQLVFYKPLGSPIPPITGSKCSSIKELAPSKECREVTTDERTGTVRTTRKFDKGTQLLEPHGLIKKWKRLETTEIQPDDPTTAQLHITEEFGWSREKWIVTGKYQLDFSLDEENFYIKEDRTCSHNGEQVFNKSTHDKIPRNGV